jgi:pyridoxine 5-phosphate synthase
MTNLSVNLNAAAYIRNRRDHRLSPHLRTPNLSNLASIALHAGAKGITLHPRPDERHVRFDDLPHIRKICSPPSELNIEGFPSEPFLKLISRIKPDQVTLVPDDPSQSTSDHGWPAHHKTTLLKNAIQSIHSDGARVSVFAEPIDDDISFLASLGVDRIELYTGPFAVSFGTPENQDILHNLSRAAEKAQQLGLAVNAGHDLNLDNLALLISHIPSLAEVSIGHALISHALAYGLPEAVHAYNTLLAS